MCDGPHAGFPRRVTLAAPKREWQYTEETPSGAAPTSPPEGVFRHKRLMELDELSGRITRRLGYIGPQRGTPDQRPLLRHRAVGPADVQRWIHAYGDRGPAPLVRRK